MTYYKQKPFKANFFTHSARPTCASHICISKRNIQSFIAVVSTLALI